MLIIALVLFTISSIADIQWSVVGKTTDGHTLTQIHQTLPVGWYTYWKNPGDSGEKARISSTDPHVTLGHLQFPKPTVLTTDPLITYGYSTAVTYTLPIQTSQSTVHATFHWLECESICIPKETDIVLTIPPQPLSIISTHPPLPSIPVTTQATASHLTFTIGTPITSAEFFPYTNGYIQPKSRALTTQTLSYKLLPPTPRNIEGELYINDHSTPIQINHTLPVPSYKFSYLLVILSTAFLGGALLNIMPCVLPILGIKAIQMQQTPVNKRGSYAILYALGVIGSIQLLFLTLLFIQSTGAIVGWGFQLQSPLVIIGLSGLFIICLLSALDVIIVQLPKWLRQSHSSNALLSGVLTTLVATPCTAPFLGAALSVALFQPPLIGWLIFLSIGLGLALPMSIIICNKTAISAIPKSGIWGQRIKHTMAIGFALSIAWLFWVLSSQIPALPILTLIVFIFLVVLYATRNHPHTNHRRIAITYIALAMALGSFGSNRSTSNQWTPYSPSQITTLEATHQAYFIDVTAKWCITCQVNKRTTLSSTALLNQFKQRNIQLIVADWTTYNDAVTQLLQRFNQVSIPTYIYFDGKSHTVLSDIITINDISELMTTSSPHIN